MYFCKQNFIAMNRNISFIRLREARLMRGFSMNKLIELMGVGVSKQSISRYEKGLMNPNLAICQAMAKALGVSVGYLFGESISIDMPMLRSTTKNKLSESDLMQIEARITFWAEHYLAKEREAGRQVDFVNPLEDIPITNMDEASKAADLLRERWNCGDGPISSILRLLERKSIKILDTKLPQDIWGMSTWADKTHPLIVIDTSKGKTTVDRLRFTVGHELGHLLLTFSQDIESKMQEKLCNKFASFFLFPRHTFIEEMGSETRNILTLDELIDLKETYGVSVAAQVHEAWDIRMITREHYDWWYDKMIKKNTLETGWGTYRFPETLGREKRIESILANCAQKNQN